MSHYDILGVSQTSDYAEIKRSYRQLVKKYHPDINPSVDAKMRITRITQAYEVLSDAEKRQAYDYYLTLGHETITDPELADFYKNKPEVDEREHQRREYVNWKRQRDQEVWQKQFAMKVKFYKYQRYFAFFFLSIGAIYSADYFVTIHEGPYDIGQTVVTKWGDAQGQINNRSFSTDEEFINELQDGSGRGYLYHSGIFRFPVGVSTMRSGMYILHGTLHSFRNFFSYMLLSISGLLLYYRKYNDLILTLGLVPFFVSLFLLLLTLTYIS